MRILFIFSLTMFIAGALAIINGIQDQNALLTAMGAVCWSGMNFMELVMMKDDLNKKCGKRGNPEVRSSKHRRKEDER